MKINEITTKARQSAKRKGRGISAGQGKTAGRGTKGQNARSGGRRRPGFEGGQIPLFQRIPKQRGFKSHRKAATLTLSQVESLKAATISLTSLIENGVIDADTTRVKVVASGSITSKVALDESVAVTKAAAAAIEKAGGSVVNK